MPQNIPIKFRRDTTTNLNTVDPIPNEGEPIFNKETGSFKIGNNILKWSELPDYKDGKFGDIVTVSKTDKFANFCCADEVYGGSDAACIKAALESLELRGGGELLIMSGHYACNQQVHCYTSNITIRGQGGTTLLDFSNVPSTPSAFVYLAGQITTTTSVLSVDAAKGSLTITVATGEGTRFTAGDWIRIRSEAIWRVFHDTPPYGQTVGEIQQIASVSGDVITLKEYLNGEYKTSDTATVDLVIMRENITVRDLKIIGPPGIYHSAIHIQQAAQVCVENVEIEDAYYTGIVLWDVVNASVNHNTIKRSTKEGEGYGLAVMCACRNISGFGNSFNDCRHGIMCGGSYYYGVQYNQTYIGNKMSYDPHVVGMFGPHSTYSGLTAIGNVCSGGCSLGFFNGPNNVVIGNIVEYTKTVPGIFLPSCCENTIVSENIIHSAANHGIKVQSNGSNINISDNHIHCYGAGFDGISISHQAKKINVVNNQIESVGAGITVTTYGGIEASDIVSIKDNTISVSGTEVGIAITSTTQTISNVSIQNNKINAVSSHGIDVTCDTKNVSNISIKNNDIIVPYTAIYVANSNSTGSHSNITINENECHGGGIDVDGVAYIDVKNNHMYDTPDSAIIIHEDCTHYHIVSNDFTACASTISNNAGITDKIIMGNIGYNPTGPITAPTMPISGGLGRNNYGYPCQVQISGGTVTEITLNGINTGLTSFFGIIPPGGTIAMTYSSAPTWKWWGL